MIRSLVFAIPAVAFLIGCDGSDASSERARRAPETSGGTTEAAEPAESAEPWGGLRVRWTGGTDGSGGGDGPVVVLLHGYGAPGDDLVPVARSLSGPEGTRFLLPEAPISLGPGARAWWHLDADRLRRRFGAAPDEATTFTPPGLATARARMLALLADLRRRGVPTSRIVLAGFSQGAMLALDVALHLDEDVAGVVVMSGGLIASGQWGPRMAARRGVPVLITHGRADPLLPFFMAEQLQSRLTEASVPVELVAFDGDHTIHAAVPPRVEAFLDRVLEP